MAGNPKYQWLKQEKFPSQGNAQEGKHRTPPICDLNLMVQDGGSTFQTAERERDGEERAKQEDTLSLKEGSWKGPRGNSPPTDQNLVTWPYSYGYEGGLRLLYKGEYGH